MTSIQEEADPIPGGNHSEGLPRSHKRRCPDLYAQFPSEGRTKLVRKAKKNSVCKWSFFHLDDSLNVRIICRDRLKSGWFIHSFEPLHLRGLRLANLFHPKLSIVKSAKDGAWWKGLEIFPFQTNGIFYESYQMELLVFVNPTEPLVRGGWAEKYLFLKSFSCSFWQI